jgi:hypothetical protein
LFLLSSFQAISSRRKESFIPVVGSPLWSLRMLVRPGSFEQVVLLVGIVGLTGCSQGGGRERNPTEDRLYRLGMVYVRSCHALGRGPGDFGEIKDKIEGDIPEDCLVSPNDGQPFVIHWGVDVTGLRFTRQNTFYVLAYERTGANGARHVLRYPVGLVLMTDEELRKAAFPPGHKPPS